MLHRIGYERGRRRAADRLPAGDERDLRPVRRCRTRTGSWRTRLRHRRVQPRPVRRSRRRRTSTCPRTPCSSTSVVAGDTGSAGGSYALPHAVGDVRARRRLALAAHRSDDVRARRAVRARAGRQGRVRHRQLHVRGGVRLRARTARSTSTSSATGTTLNQGVAHAADGDRYGTTVVPNIAAPNHQHFFNFRIDFDVDGTDNRVVEENIVSRAERGGQRVRRGARRRSRRSSSATRTRRRAGTGWSRAPRR